MLQLTILPIELIYRLMAYLSISNLYHLSLTNKLINNYRLERFLYNQRLLTNYGSPKDILEDWFIDFIKSKEYRYIDYLNDIYNSIFLQDLEPCKKSIFKQNIFKIKRLFDYRSFRKILIGNQFTQFPLQQNDYQSVKIRVHIMYRIDTISYLRLKNKHKNILALIY